MDLPTVLSVILAAADHGADAAGATAEGGAHAATEKHHRSELPFFFAGGMLATFAIVISVVGFKKPEFPANEAAARGVMVVSAVLVASAMFTAVYVAL